MVDAAIISGLLTNLAPFIRDEFSLFSSFKKDVQKLSSKLSSLHVVLEDAERRIRVEEKDKQTEDWLRKLKDVAYEVRDIMDECAFEDLRLQVRRLNASSSTRVQVTNCIAHPFSITWARLKIGHKIKDVLKKLDQISSERNNLHLYEIIHDKRPDNSWLTRSTLSEKVYGRDNEKEKIVDILTNASHNDTEKLSILPILGLGGLGKTTLAQMVFNDEEITKCFDVKYWVCVSKEFDIKLVIKAILGVTNENSLPILQNEVQDKLRGKKYLIVLDDVWNENVQKWNELRSILDCGSNGSFILTTTRKRNVAEIMKSQVQYFELLPLSDDACWLLFKEVAFEPTTSKSPNMKYVGLEIVKKCKGVPLVVKTLGAGLRFNDDFIDWYKIRDSDMWKISQNEEYDILSILRLSYYDLSYTLRRCFAFCAIFPRDTKFEKEMLIQLWMAHDLIPPNEDDGNKIWDELYSRSLFQDKKEEINRHGKYIETCKMQTVIHDLAQSIMKEECYIIDDQSLSGGSTQNFRHIMIDGSRKISAFDSLKIKGDLQTVILLPENLGTLSKEILSVLKEFSSLRVLQVSFDVQSQDLLYVGSLKHLRYLNFSGSEITILPDSICDLLNLQTLNLNDCEFLESLPRNTKNLINLRHLHLKGCYRLKYMPRGMGQLRHLKTLSMFMIGKESDGQFDELKELDIGGYMEIGNLERVSDACITRGGISMSQKSSMNQLELHWNDYRPFDDDNQNKSIRDERICEALEVPTRKLKTLGMRGYKGVNIPKWVAESSASLTMLHLSDLDNVEYIFTMNNMNTSVGRNDMNEMVFISFPWLKDLSISKMENLRELVCPRIPITIATGVFPNLWKIEIKYCPKLGALPSHLKSLKNVIVEGECTDELFYSILDFNGLTDLSLTNVNEKSVLFPAAVNDMMSGTSVVIPFTHVTLFPLLEKLEIRGMENLRELVSPTAAATGAFPNLCKILINRCPKLGAVPSQYLKSLKDVTVKGECSDELLNSISNLSGLAHLTLMFMEERSVLFGGSAPTFQSLRHLEIQFCYKLSCLFDEKLASTSCLRNLNSLTIIGCRNLMISLEQLRNLAHSHSLQSLEITNCPKFVPSKVEEITLISSLREKLGSKNFRGDIRQGRRCRNCTPTIPLKKDLVEILNGEDIGDN